VVQSALKDALDVANRISFQGLSNVHQLQLNDLHPDFSESTVDRMIKAVFACLQAHCGKAEIRHIGFIFIKIMSQHGTSLNIFEVNIHMRSTEIYRTLFGKESIHFLVNSLIGHPISLYMAESACIAVANLCSVGVSLLL
jgi:hypothetical protein